MPFQHGLTIGALLARAKSDLGVDLWVVPARVRADRVTDGVQLHVTEAGGLRPLEAVVRTLAHLRATHDTFAWVDAGSMPGRCRGPSTRTRARHGTSPFADR